MSEQVSKPEMKICPLRALAYTIAKLPNNIREPTCIGDRCAWYFKGFCAVTMLHNLLATG
jgi:hypothetical protein